MQLHTKILLGLLAGALMGPVLGDWAVRLEPVGQAFIRLLIMTVIPLVMASLILGAANLGDPRKLGRIGLKTVGFYLVATSLACALGLFVALAIRPGSGMDEQVKQRLLSDYGQDRPAAADPLADKPGLQDILFNIIPRNPFASMAAMEMLQVIFFALCVGVALTLVAPPKRQPLLDVLISVNDAMVALVNLVMKLAPIGVFALIAAVSGRFGYGVLLSLMGYVLVTLAAMLLFTLSFYPLVLRLCGMRPTYFFSRFREVMLFAFSTSSSNATLPLNLKVTEEDLGVSRGVASFVLPLGATVNMNGTSIYQGVSAVFIAQVYGIELGLEQMAVVVVTATLASIGAAGVPGVGFITLAIALQSIGVPLEGLALILGVERLLDMARTTLNVTGDAVSAVWVAHTERELKLPRASPDTLPDPA